MTAHEDPRPAATTTQNIPPRANWMQRTVGSLYTHNPFYLLSVAFVLHSTRLWLNTRVAL